MIRLYCFAFTNVGWSSTVLGSAMREYVEGI
jgi:hypothetical protein